MKMKITITKDEEKVFKELEYIGDQRDMKIYSNHNNMVSSHIELLCNCGKRHCIHKKMLLLQEFKNYRVDKK